MCCPMLGIQLITLAGVLTKQAGCDKRTLSTVMLFLLFDAIWCHLLAP